MSHDANYSKGVNLADVDLDGSLDVIAASSTGQLNLWRQNGTRFPGFPVNLSGRVQASRAVGDLDGDGDLEIVVSTNSPSSSAFISAYHHTGARLPGWPRVVGPSWEPTLYDLNNDGRPEIIFADLQHVQARFIDGTMVPGFPTSEIGYTAGAVAVGDLDGDGSPEILVKSLNPDIYLYCFHADGSLAEGWPKYMGFESYFGGPSMADLDGDHRLEALATCSGSGFTYLHAFSGDGTPVPGFPLTVDGLQCYSSPVIGDLNLDGSPEIYFSTKNATGSLYGVDNRGAILHNFPVYYQLNVECSPIIGNLDLDPDLEVLVADTEDPGDMIAFNRDGSTVDGFPFYQVVGPGPASPALGDLDGDGDAELAMTSHFGSVYVWDLNTPWHPQKSMWSTFLHDNWNTSQYGFISPDETADVSEWGGVASERLVQAFPNPFSATTRLVLRSPVPTAPILIIDPAGRLVRELAPVGASGADPMWDGRDAAGRDLPSGRYLIRNSSASAGSVILLR